MIGKTISHYRIIEKLGRCGMGVVLLTEHTNLNRQVTVKVLPNTFPGDPERLAHFDWEAKLRTSLNHLNIDTVCELKRTDSTSVLAMGETLAGRIAKNPSPVDEGLEICRQIAEGFEAVRDKGAIHRDLKPASGKITPEGKVQIFDLRLAKVFHAVAAALATEQSSAIREACEAVAHIKD